MKYLECPKLAWLTSLLTSCEVGELQIDGRIEAFTCKMAGEDKRLQKVLESQYVKELAASPAAASASPLGPMSEVGTRKLLIRLISTLNASFPDYDFSTLRPEHFVRGTDLDAVIRKVNASLAELIEVAHVGVGFLEELWTAINEVIPLRESQIYSYIPDDDSDPFSDGRLWSFNYFFYHKERKKIVFFTCMATSKLHSPAAVEGQVVAMEEDSRVALNVDRGAWRAQSPAKSPGDAHSEEEDDAYEIDSETCPWDDDEMA